MAEFSGTPTGAQRRFAVVASRFNHQIVERLVDGALDALVRHGVAADDVDAVWVPGAWELPMAARHLLASERYNAIVAGEAARGLATASVDFDTPIGFGLLTCENDAQARARAGGGHGNKGWDAAVAALEMADLFDRLDAADSC